MAKAKKFTHPKVGIGVMVIKQDKVLMHTRKGSHGEGEYSFPGGHLELYESFEQCARREIKEEAGIEIKNVQFLFVANVKKYIPTHYAHIGLIAHWKSGRPTNLEPKKSSEWFWADIKNPPKPMFLMAELAFVALKTGKNYFDS